MKTALLALSVLGAHAAYAYEYPLQFTPRSGARGLVVAGYEFSGDTVVGDCSYHTSISTGGRGGHSVTTYYYNVCTWDLFGNLLSLTPASTNPAAPAVLATSGTEVIYADNGTNTTGRDTRGFGFVTTPSSHYSWETVNGAYAVIPYTVYTVTVDLMSDGDVPLTFNSGSVTAFISGAITPAPGTATVSSTTCPSSVPVGTPCSVTVSYDPTTIKCTGSPYGYGYTGIDLSLETDSPIHTDWTERFTVTGIPVCDD